MKFTTQIANNLREIYFGGNWTWSCLKEHLQDVTWQQATTQIYSFNTIATVVYHMNYYLNAVYNVLLGEELKGKHAESFRHPEIRCHNDWQKMLDRTWRDAEKFARVIEELPESLLGETFSEEKFGNYYRNINGVIEHNHYHLGQIVLMKKLLLSTVKKQREAVMNQ